MRRNIVAVGEQVISGEVGKVYAAGEVCIKEADVEALNGAGEVNIEYSHIKNTHIAGEIKGKSSRFDTLKIAGKAELSGSFGDKVVIMGELFADELECRILRNFTEKLSGINSNDWKKGFVYKKNVGFDYNNYDTEKEYKWDINIDLNLKKDKTKEVKEEENQNTENQNTENQDTKNQDTKNQDAKNSDTKSSDTKSRFDSRFSGSITAQTFENLCDFNLDFQYKFTNIISLKPLSSEDIVECENFYSFHKLDLEGINAENIVIHPQDEAKVGQIMGSNIRIGGGYEMDESFHQIPISIDVSRIKRELSMKPAILYTDSIEGDQIHINDIYVQRVSGDTIYVGPNCTIDKIEYRDTISISPEAKVGEIIKL